MTALLSRLRVLALVAVLGLVAAACGTDDDSAVEENPSQALQESFESLADYDGFELTIRLDADPAALQAALEDEDVDEDILDLVLNSSIRLRTTGDDPEDAAAEYAVIVDGDTLGELRVLGEADLYFRIDLDAIIALADDPELAAEVDGLVAEADAFGFGELAGAVQAGDWVHLTGLQQAMEMFDGMVEPDDIDEDEAEEIAEEILAAIERFLDEDVEVSFVASEDAGERVRATASGAALQGLLAEVMGVVGGTGMVDDFTTDQLLRELEEDIPDDITVSVDAWISGGEIQQVGIDVNELADGELGAEFLVLVEIAEFTDGIDAPDDAVEIDLFGMLGGMFGGMMMEDPFEEFEDEAFDEDLFEDEGLEDDLFDQDAPAAELGDECVTQQEIDELREFVGDEAADELEALIDAGIIERC